MHGNDRAQREPGAGAQSGALPWAGARVQALRVQCPFSCLLLSVSTDQTSLFDDAALLRSVGLYLEDDRFTGHVRQVHRDAPLPMATSCAKAPHVRAGADGSATPDTLTCPWRLSVLTLPAVWPSPGEAGHRHPPGWGFHSQVGCRKLVWWQPAPCCTASPGQAGTGRRAGLPSSHSSRSRRGQPLFPRSPPRVSFLATRVLQNRGGRGWVASLLAWPVPQPRAVGQDLGCEDFVPPLAELRAQPQDRTWVLLAPARTGTRKLGEVELGPAPARPHGLT